ncbi:MAG: hypothetical protein ACR2HR_02135 [Euzebya sp.]
MTEHQTAQITVQVRLVNESVVTGRVTAAAGNHLLLHTPRGTTAAPWSAARSRRAYSMSWTVRIRNPADRC